MKISDIVGQLSGGLARSNRFIVDLTPPQAITSALRGVAASNLNSSVTDLSELQRILLLCDSAQLPGFSLTTTPVRSFGEVREIPYEINYEPISLSFYVDTEMNVKRMFDLWMLSTQLGDTRKLNYYDDYTTQMKIFVQDMSENNRYIVELFEVYPKSVGPVQLDYSNKDVMKLQVNLEYKYWRSYQVAYARREAAEKPEFFDYTTNINLGNYTNNFYDIQQEYNQEYGAPEGLGEYTGDTITSL